MLRNKINDRGSDFGRRLTNNSYPKLGDLLKERVYLPYVCTGSSIGGGGFQGPYSPCGPDSPAFLSANRRTPLPGGDPVRSAK